MIKWFAQFIHRFFTFVYGKYVRTGKKAKLLALWLSLLAAGVKLALSARESDPKEWTAKIYLFASQFILDFLVFVMPSLLAFAAILAYFYALHEKHLIQLQYEGKEEVAKNYLSIRKSRPNDHYLALIVGRLRDQAMEVKMRKGKDILDAINKNIKKNERVYWVSSRDIGIIMYEVNGKPYDSFLFVIFKKLFFELGNEVDTRNFLNNIDFYKLDVSNLGGDLLDAEHNAQNMIFQGQGKAWPELVQRAMEAYMEDKPVSRAPTSLLGYLRRLFKFS